jgi:hypothetical protein
LVLAIALGSAFLGACFGPVDSGPFGGGPRGVQPTAVVASSGALLVDWPAEARVAEYHVRLDRLADGDVRPILELDVARPPLALSVHWQQDGLLRQLADGHYRLAVSGVSAGDRGIRRQESVIVGTLSVEGGRFTDATVVDAHDRPASTL